MPVHFVLISISTVAALFVAMVLLQAWGKRLGEHHRRRDPINYKEGHGTAETAVLGVLGLFIAFTFSGAAERVDGRRQLIADETNAMGTAWLRIDLLPDDRQPEIRDLFRQYVDARLEAVRGDPPAASVAAARAIELQGKIWTASVSAARASGQVPPLTLMVPALNAMFDITTTRRAATYRHPPPAVFAMVALLALVGALFVGFGSAGHAAPSRIHMFGFALVLALVVYIILELEFPRFGVIRVNRADQIMIDLRHSMN